VFEGLPDYDTTQLAHKQKKAKRSGQAERSGEEGLELPPDYDNTTRTHAKKGQTERSGQAERSGKWGFGSLSRPRHNTARPRAEESQANRSGQAERS
jgi:hypothetical protein